MLTLVPQVVGLRTDSTKQPPCYYKLPHWRSGPAAAFVAVVGDLPAPRRRSGLAAVAFGAAGIAFPSSLALALEGRNFEA